jgi:hypothetical protein
MASRPVIVQYPKGDAGAGAEYEVESAAVARKVHPGAKIVRFGDTQEPYSEDAPKTEAAARKAAAEPATETKD